MAKTIPADWGHGAREGVVVEFERADGSVWVGNFEPGLGGIDDVRRHPNGSEVLVIASGQLWSVEPTTQDAVRLAPAVFGVWELSAPHRLLFNNQDLGFVCVERDGVVWATGRISWDGFRSLRIDGEILEGEAWSPIEDRWLPFRVNLTDGAVVGGSYSGPEMTFADVFERRPEGPLVQKDRARAAEIAGAVLNGQLGPVEGAIELNRRRSALGVADRDADFDVFVLIDSECDALPIGPVRQHWAPEALLRKEADVTRAQDWAMKVGERAFRSVVARFGTTA